MEAGLNLPRYDKRLHFRDQLLKTIGYRDFVVIEDWLNELYSVRSAIVHGDLAPADRLVYQPGEDVHRLLRTKRGLGTRPAAHRHTRIARRVFRRITEILSGRVQNPLLDQIWHELTVSLMVPNLWIAEWILGFGPYALLKDSRAAAEVNARLADVTEDDASWDLTTMEDLYERLRERLLQILRIAFRSPATYGVTPLTRSSLATTYHWANATTWMSPLPAPTSTVLSYLSSSLSIDSWVRLLENLAQWAEYRRYGLWDLPGD